MAKKIFPLGLSEEEKALIQERTNNSQYKNMSDYIRAAALSQVPPDAFVVEEPMLQKIIERCGGELEFIMKLKKLTGGETPAQIAEFLSRKRETHMFSGCTLLDYGYSPDGDIGFQLQKGARTWYVYQDTPGYELLAEDNKSRYEKGTVL